MPLVSGKKAKTKKGFNENVKREVEAGKDPKQAVAIAYSKKREAEKKEMMSKKEPMSVTISDVYNEIIQLSRSVGGCASSIEHLEDSMIRIYDRLKESLDKIDNRLLNLEQSESYREKRSKFLWGLLNLSPGNIFKWASAIVLIVSICSTMMRMDIDKLINRFFQVVMG